MNKKRFLFWWCKILYYFCVKETYKNKLNIMIKINTKKIKKNKFGSYPTVIIPFYKDKDSLSKIGIGVRIITSYNPNTDAFERLFIVAKDNHALSDIKAKSEINYDKMFNQLKKTYTDVNNREMFVFKQKEHAEIKLNSFIND